MCDLEIALNVKGKNIYHNGRLVKTSIEQNMKDFKKWLEIIKGRKNG